MTSSAPPSSATTRSKTLAWGELSSCRSSLRTVWYGGVGARRVHPPVARGGLGLRQTPTPCFRSALLADGCLAVLAPAVTSATVGFLASGPWVGSFGAR